MQRFLAFKRHIYSTISLKMILLDFFLRKKLVFMDINPSIYNKDSTISTDEMEAEETLLQHIAELDQVRTWKLLRIF